MKACVGHVARTKVSPKELYVAASTAKLPACMWPRVSPTCIVRDDTLVVDAACRAHPHSECGLPYWTIELASVLDVALLSTDRHEIDRGATVLATETKIAGVQLQGISAAVWQVRGGECGVGVAA